MALNSTCNSLATDYRSIYKRLRLDNYYSISRDTYSAPCFVVEIHKNGKPMICLYCVSDFLFLPAEKWSGGSYAYDYAYSTSTAIFRLILLFNITPQCTLHSRVKDSITHNSTVILFSKLLGRLICYCKLCFYNFM